MLERIKSLFRPKATPIVATEKSKGMRISSNALATNGRVFDSAIDAARETFKIAKPMPGVVPAGMAMDAAFDDQYAYAVQNSTFAEGLSFMGYPYLSDLCQRSEYRRPSEVLAKEMTRAWIKLQCTGEDDKADKLREIDAELKRLKAQDVFRRAAELDGFFGRGQIYIDTGATDNPNELRLPLYVDANKIQRGALKRLTTVEPIWTYPNQYNSTDPLKPDFYRPSSWFVMGKEIHASRMMTFVSREVPDLLKPAYAFGGLSLSQLAKPYIDNWLRTRQSVSDLIHSFSVMGLKTNLSGILNGGAGEEMFSRAQLFNQARDNRSLMMIDKDTEEFFNVAVPLGSLDHLQAQSQEHMSACTGIPLVVLLGITPSGLNASSEGEIEAYHKWVNSQQEAVLGPQLSKLLELVQINLYGEIDPEIGFRWKPLWTESETDLANARKTESDTDCAYIDRGVLSPAEVRTRLAADHDSPYASLDLSEVPEVPGGEGDPFAEGSHLDEAE